MLLKEMKENEAKMEWYNGTMTEIRKKKGMTYENSNFQNNLFLPYHIWQSSIINDDFEEYNIIPDTLSENDTAGVYVADPNAASHLFTLLTDYEFAKKRPTKSGICDNASQVLETYHKLVDDPNRLYVVFLSPVFKCDQQPEAGFKWKRYGKYIGVHKRKESLLVDEPDIGFIFKYNIYEIKKN